MRWRLLLYLGMVLCNWSVFASVAGDVNGDGRVDVADLERAYQIKSGVLPFEAAADVDGDQAVTEIDLWLIQEALLGRPIPQRVAQKNIGSSGGTLTHSDISITIPAGTVGTHSLSLFLCPNESLDSDTPLHNVYMICGLSSNLAGVTVAYQNCDSNMGLAVGGYMQPHDTGKMSWHWNALTDAGFTRNGTEINRSFPPPQAHETAISHSIKLGIVSGVAPPAFNMQQSVTAQPMGGVQPLSSGGRRYAGYRYTGWLSDRFNVYTKDWGTISYSALEELCDKLYVIYNKIEGLGFPLSTEHAALFPVEVRVVKDMKEDGCFVSSIFGEKWIEVNAKLLSQDHELYATLGHELMHHALSPYQRGDSFAFASVEDAITTWFEAVAADKPEHRSNNYIMRPAAPLKGLFVPVTRDWTGSRDWGPQEQRGYATSAFIDYHFDDNRDQVYKLAQKVRAGKNIKTALNDQFVEKYGDLYDLERKYLEFAREYLLSSSNCYSSILQPDAIFASDGDTDTSEMYKLITIKEATTNLFQEQSVELKVQDFGCGVVQFKIFKPDRIFAPHTRLLVKAPAFSKCVDLLVQTRSANGKTTSEIVTGIYEQEAGEEGKWGCSIVMPRDINYMLISALVTLGNHGGISNYTEIHDLTMTYQFEGDHYMPMQEMFTTYTELSSQSIYYNKLVRSDAIMRVIDPGGAAGLENFRLTRTTTLRDEPGLNYKFNLGFTSIIAWRRTTSAFQLRVFTDTSVPELPGFSILANPEGFTPYYFTYNGQKPVTAQDGSVEMKVMLYHVPDSAISQLIPGNAEYRLQNITTSSAQMQQSADGNSGGVLLDIPAQISDYRCLIYVFTSVISDDPDTNTAFLMGLYPMLKGGTQ